MSIKLAIGCDHKLLGEGIKKLVAGDREISIAGVFSPSENLDGVGKKDPDVILLDLHAFQTLPGEFFFPPKSKVLLIGDSFDQYFLPDRFGYLISKGVAGVLSPGVTLPIFKKALSCVSSGELWFGRKLMAQMIHHACSYRREKEKLTDMEKRVADLICLGLRNKEIAQRLNISEKTVKAHCNRIYRKLDVPDRLRLAIKLGRNRNQ